MMRALMFAAGAALTLAACSGGAESEASNDLNAMTMDNMGMDANAAGTDGGMDGNLATNATTENLMLNDLTTNDADTNLANGM